MATRKQTLASAKANKKTKTGKHFSMLPFSSGEFTAAPALDYVGISPNTIYQCFEPPINRFALAKLPAQNAQHCGILQSRANMICANFEGGGLSKMEMRALCQNLIQFGDVGVLKVRNGFGKVVRLVVLSSLYLRRKLTGGYIYLMRKSLTDMQAQEVYEYAENDVIFIKLYDPRQQMYGSPDYIGGINAALLNSEATCFRRRYFSNGAHMGFILYSTDPDMSEEMEEEIADKIRHSKGVGNFRSMFINIPDGHPDGLKVIPVGDTGTKDEFANIKNISAQDVLTAHRFPPGLGGIIPSNSGGFGDPLKMREAYQLDEIIPMREMISEAINRDPDITGALRIAFRETV